MMIIVPALAKREHRQPDVVAAVILGIEAASAVTVRQRIDRHCGVEQHDRRYKESPYQKLAAAGADLRRYVAEHCTESV